MNIKGKCVSDFPSKQQNRKKFRYQSFVFIILNLVFGKKGEEENNTSCSMTEEISQGKALLFASLYTLVRLISYLMRLFRKQK